MGPRPTPRRAVIVATDSCSISPFPLPLRAIITRILRNYTTRNHRRRIPFRLGSRTNWNFPIPWRNKGAIPFPFGGEQRRQGRNRNRLLIVVAPPRRALPKLVLGILIIYTGGFFFFFVWFGFVPFFLVNCMFGFGFCAVFGGILGLCVVEFL